MGNDANVRAGAFAGWAIAGEGLENAHCFLLFLYGLCLYVLLGCVLGVMAWYEGSLRDEGGAFQAGAAGYSTCTFCLLISRWSCDITPS